MHFPVSGEGTDLRNFNSHHEVESGVTFDSSKGLTLDVRTFQ